MSKLDKDFKELLEDFKSVHEKISPQINEKLRIAHEAFQEAIDLSDKHGVPFKTTDFINGGNQRYIPQSVVDGKFLCVNDYEGIVKNGIEELTGAWFPRYGSAGWANSSSDC